VRVPGRTADPSAALPRISVEICGVDVLHAPFFAERRTRGPVQGYVAGIRVWMTKRRAAIFSRSCQVGWIEEQQVPALRSGRDDNSV
jgi:hypothetical protein